MTVAYLGLGANLGDAKQSLKDAVISLAQRPGIIVLAKSSLYRTAPVDAEGDDFYNCVVAVGTLLPPAKLLALVQGVEHEFGRERPYRNAPRTLDIDILLYGDEQVDEQIGEKTGDVITKSNLTIPHPRLTQRAFALVPLLELDAAVVIPGQGAAASFVDRLADQVIEIVATCQCPLLSDRKRQTRPTQRGDSA
jgi:2-amino-4-hydroxy-6-hydroxymethyldihydropteridine diphosphokinase